MSAPEESRATEGATYRCEGCGEWLDEADVVRVQGSYTGHEVASRGSDGYPTPDLCGPVSRIESHYGCRCTNPSAATCNTRCLRCGGVLRATRRTEQENRDDG